MICSFLIPHGTDQFLYLGEVDETHFSFEEISRLTREVGVHVFINRLEDRFIYIDILRLILDERWRRTN